MKNALLYFFLVFFYGCDLEVIPDDTTLLESSFISSFGNDSPDAGQTVVQLSSGEYIVGGYGDAKVVKLDPVNGEVMKSLNPNAYSLWVEDIMVNRQDEIYLVGFAQTEEGGQTVSRGVILRLDEELNIQQEIFGNREGDLPDIDWYFSILQAPDGKYNVLSIRRENSGPGFSIGLGSLPFVNPPVANTLITSFNTNYRVFLRTAAGKFLVVGNDLLTGSPNLLQVAANRNVVEEAFFVGELIIGDVLIGPDGNYLMAGEVDDRPHLSVIRPDGSMVYSSSLLNRDGVARKIITTRDGYLVMGMVEVGPNGGYDIFLMHLDEDYNQLWLKYYGGAFDELGADLIATQDGGYLFVGGSKSFGSGDNDYYFVKTDANGEITE